MTFEIGIVLGVIVLIIIALYLEIFRPAMTLFFGIMVLVFTNVLTPSEALQGFANEQLAVIVLLLIIGNILKKSSIIDSGFRFLLNSKDDQKSFLTKMSLGIGSLSAFFNNTPLVAMMMPYVFTWSREKKLAVSKFLIPLSYASILGGCVTLIGTSTNLIVNGMAVQQGESSLQLFDFAIVGLPMLVIGVVYLVFFSRKLLPDSGDALDDVVSSARKFFFETIVEDGSVVVGKTVQEAGLRNLDDLFLVEIKRGDRTIRPVSSHEVMKAGDSLFFAGTSEGINNLTETDIQLSLPIRKDINRLKRANISEIVISSNSRLAGVAVRDTEFRSKYDGVILAIHRNGEKLWGQLGKIILKPGDVLLVMAGKDFDKLVEKDPNFYILSNQIKPKPISWKRITVLLVGMLAAIVLSSAGILPLFTCLAGLIGIAILLETVKPKEIVASLDFHLILVIAMGLSLGTAMTNSKADDMIGAWIQTVGSDLGPIGILTILFVITNVLSGIVTTQAAVAVTLPVSLVLGHAMGGPMQPYIMVIAFAGAANFITPIGYQTNLMVYGPGGYKFRDYFKVGLPLTILYLIVCVLMLVFWYDL